MTYWKSRQNLEYYKQVKSWLEELREFDSLIDVGSADTPIATWGSFKKRTAINRDFAPHLKGVECLKGNWMKAEATADVITCLQVLEHFETDFLKQFASKLFSSSKITIISVPYLWRNGACIYHKQDPISMNKLIELVGREPIKTAVATDNNVKRLVAMFQGDN